MLQIREYQPEDKERVKRLVLDLKKYYPGIEDWMNKEVQRIESKKFSEGIGYHTKIGGYKL